MPGQVRPAINHPPAFPSTEPRCSPEISPSGKFDYSVSVFDPFESCESSRPARTSPDAHPPQGKRHAANQDPNKDTRVFVGLGWMSDALGSSDSPNVIGTISSDGIHDDSIEVCFCIRKVHLFACAPPASPQCSLQGNRV